MLTLEAEAADVLCIIKVLLEVRPQRQAACLDSRAIALDDLLA